MTGQSVNPAMPDPERVVRKNVSHLRRAGLSELEALAVIGTVAASAERLILRMGDYDVAWLRQVGKAAVLRAERLMSNAQVSAERTREGVRDGDGGEQPPAPGRE